MVASDSFAEFLSRDDLPDFDFITLHGIYSWVSPENRRTIVEFIRRNEEVALGLSVAQYVSLAMVIAGVVWLLTLRPLAREPQPPAAFATATAAVSGVIASPEGGG